MHRKAAFVSLFLLLGVIPAQLTVSVQGTPDWLGTWSYRKSHEIHPAKGAGTDYSIRLTVHYSDETDDIADNAIHEWYMAPAEHYQGRHRRTYIAYYSSDSEVKVLYYDHDLRFLSDPVTIAQNWGSGDDHSSPTLHVIKHGRDAGRILIAYAEHNGRLKTRRSTSAEDISLWDSPVSVESDNATYAKL